jgi:hypothetical protein
MNDVCMDVYCTCGEDFHACTHSGNDGSPEYMRCPHCTKVLRMSAEIELLDRQIDYRKERGLPSASIQYKGTITHMTAHCKCGHDFDVNRDFAYEVDCPACRQHYFVETHPTITEVDESTLPAGTAILAPEKDPEWMN